MKRIKKLSKIPLKIKLLCIFAVLFVLYLMFLKAKGDIFAKVIHDKEDYTGGTIIYEGNKYHIRISKEMRRTEGDYVVIEGDLIEKHGIIEPIRYHKICYDENSALIVAVGSSIYGAGLFLKEGLVYDADSESTGAIISYRYGDLMTQSKRKKLYIQDIRTVRKLEHIENCSQPTELKSKIVGTVSWYSCYNNLPVGYVEYKELKRYHPYDAYLCEDGSWVVQSDEDGTYRSIVDNELINFFDGLLQVENYLIEPVTE